MLIESIHYSYVKEQGVNKRGQRIHTSEGLTNNAQKSCMKCTKKMNNKLGKRADDIKFDWVKFMSKEYFGVIDDINECYKKYWKLVSARRCFNMLMGIRVNY